MKMLILPGVAHSGGEFDPKGLLDRDSAIAYADRKGYVPVVLDVSGETGASSQQTRAALRHIRADHEITAIYGFSGGGYNARHIWMQLTFIERHRIVMLVILGAPGLHIADLDECETVLVYPDPPQGHMAGPQVLLDDTR